MIYAMLVLITITGVLEAHDGNIPMSIWLIPLLGIMLDLIALEKASRRTQA